MRNNTSATGNTIAQKLGFKQLCDFRSHTLREEIFADFNFAIQREKFANFGKGNLISQLSNILQIFCATFQ